MTNLVLTLLVPSALVLALGVDTAALIGWVRRRLTK